MGGVPGERQAAKLAGRRHYFTAEPCARGHTAARRTATGACSACAREMSRARRGYLPAEVRRERLARNARATAAGKAERTWTAILAAVARLRAEGRTPTRALVGAMIGRSVTTVSGYWRAALAAVTD